MAVIGALLLLASLLVAAAVIARVGAARHDDPAEETAGPFAESPGSVSRNAREAATGSPVDQLWQELETRLAQRPPRYPYKG